MSHTEVAIVGGGIIGLSTALELAAAGLQVTVFERGHAMAESSWAAAGMLAARDPESPPALRPLAELSLQLYPRFLEDVERLSGISIPIRTTQAIQGAWRLAEGFRELDAAVLDAFAPGLVAGGLRFFSLDEQSFDPRDLVRALPRAVRAAGVTLLEETAVTSVAAETGPVIVETSAGRWTADNLIHCSGAWATNLTGVPIAPRKGQMVMVEDYGQRLNVVLRTPEIYLVPRGHDRIVIGATIEDAGFDKQVDPAAIAQLLDKAAALWPPIRTAPIIESWAGLRPAAPDELPVIDAHGPRCWLATGHFRNGILLAPGTARLIGEMILCQPLSIDAACIRSDRFAASAVRSL